MAIDVFLKNDRACKTPINQGSHTENQNVNANVYSFKENVLRYREYGVYFSLLIGIASAFETVPSGVDPLHYRLVVLFVCCCKA
ncbi:hypothetical protein [Lacticaseibacillus sharpeae]|uniref:hypothetical protein n=1 Tax=Lacticaseibacillus sharpeae TaxID=1626 RepID=UPI0012E7C5A3|nr:hypothetical protein [Lacticaseibacillus sharpeae]